MKNLLNRYIFVGELWESLGLGKPILENQFVQITNFQDRWISLKRVPKWVTINKPVVQMSNRMVIVDVGFHIASPIGKAFLKALREINNPLKVLNGLDG